MPTRLLDRMEEEYEYLETETNLKFFEILRRFSDNKFDPVPEWELLTDKFFEKETRCICTTPIERNFYIRHKRTGKELVIGSECVKRWIHPKLTCKQCESPLGRIDKRIQTQDFVCPKCKREAKKAAKEAAEHRASRRATLCAFHFYYGKKYYGKRFDVVAKDIPYVEFLLNLQLSDVPKTLKLFKEYIGLIYELEDIEI